MPSTRRSFLAAAAATPLAARTVGAVRTPATGTDWKQTVTETTFHDSARVDGQTLLLTRADDAGTVHAVADGGQMSWSRTLPTDPLWRTLTGTADGGFVVASEAADERVTVARYGPDGAERWRHDVAVGYHDNEYAVEPLGDGSVALVTNNITTHAVSMRLQCLTPDGSVRWDRTRDAFGGVVTDTVDGALAVGGYAYVGEFDGWLDRVAPDGTVRWEQRWSEAVDAVDFGSAGGVAVGDVYRDDHDAVRIWSLDGDGAVTTAWTHHFDTDALSSTAAVARRPDGGAWIATEPGDDGTLVVLETGSERLRTTATVDPFDTRADVTDIYPTAEGYVVVGRFDADAQSGGWVVAPGERASETPTRTPTKTPTRTPTTTPTRTPTETPTPGDDPDTGTTPTVTSDTTTGDAGPGFGVVAAVTALAAGSLARFRREDET